MKKLFTLIVLITPLLSFAQVEKGMLLLSGNISYQKNAYDNPATVTSTYDFTQTELTPYAGYMVSSRIAVGLLADYRRSKLEPSSGPTDGVAKAFSAGPFIRYYHPITERFFFFAQGDVQFGKGTDSYYDSDNGNVIKVTMTSSTIAVRPGVSYFISKRWAVELILGSVSYANRTLSAGTRHDLSGFTLNFITRGMSPGVVFTF